MKKYLTITTLSSSFVCSYFLSLPLLQSFIFYFLLLIVSLFLFNILRSASLSHSLFVCLSASLTFSISLSCSHFIFHSLSFLLSLPLSFIVSLSLTFPRCLSRFLSLSLTPFSHSFALFFHSLSLPLLALPCSLSSLSYLHRDSDSNKGDDEFEVKDGGEDSGTDDEQEKKKRVPEWARGALLKTALEKVKNCGSHLFFFFVVSTLLLP